jgi:hypothetical protein
MAQEIDVQLPRGIDAAKLVRDPANRPAHWYNKETDEVFAMPKGWQPPQKAKAATTKNKDGEGENGNPNPNA